MSRLSKQQIGKAGELLVQYRLLLLGIESSQMTTDAGIDLVAYVPAKQDAVTIQVKTNLKPKPSGGKGSPAVDWWVPCDTPAQLFAFVELEQERVWLLAQAELARIAQQKSNDRWHIYIYTGSAKTSKPGATLAEMDRYLLHNRLEEVFALTTTAKKVLSV
jgi:hypothetical protein